MDDFDIDEIDEDSQISDLYVAISIADIKYAIPVEYVKEIVILPKVVPLPDSKIHIKGIIKLRDSVIPVVNTRVRFGLPTFESMDKEMIAMIAQRKQDHINWLNELYSSVDEDRTFKLTTDPHACAFGKWYDSFKTDNIAMKTYLAQFDSPHKKIHSIAEKVISTRQEKGIPEAKDIIEHTKQNELSTMIKLFDSINLALEESHREIAVIISYDDAVYALTADFSDRIVQMDNEKIKKPEKTNSKFVSGIYSDKNEVVMILNIGALLED